MQLCEFSIVAGRRGGALSVDAAATAMQRDAAAATMALAFSRA